MNATARLRRMQHSLPTPQHPSPHPSPPPSRPASTVSAAASKPLFPETQSINLPGARGTLSYATYGSPTGFPVLFLHGFPGSRLEPMLVDHLMRKHDLFVIAPDRPGFGRSTPQPGRTFADYPADLHHLTQSLGLRRYAVLGGSGGGPYAVACGHPTFGLPREEMCALGVLACAPSWEAGVKDVTWSRRILARMSRRMPTVLRIGLDAVVWVTKWILNTAYIKRLIENWIEGLARKAREKRAAEKAAKRANGEEVDDEAVEESGGLDRSDLTPAEKREMLVASPLEGFAQGAGATVEEARLLSQPWGFKFEDVDYNKVLVWHGAKDTNAPISMVRWMVGRLPHCDFKEFPEDTHYTIGSRMEQVLDDLVPESVRRG